MSWQIIEIIGAVHGDIQTNIGDYWVAFATENWFMLLAGAVCGDIPGTDWCHYNSNAATHIQ